MKYKYKKKILVIIIMSVNSAIVKFDATGFVTPDSSDNLTTLDNTLKLVNNDQNTQFTIEVLNVKGDTLREGTGNYQGTKVFDLHNDVVFTENPAPILPKAPYKVRVTKTGTSVSTTQELTKAITIDSTTANAASDSIGNEAKATFTTTNLTSKPEFNSWSWFKFDEDGNTGDPSFATLSRNVQQTQVDHVLCNLNIRESELGQIFYTEVQYVDDSNNTRHAASNLYGPISSTHIITPKIFTANPPFKEHNELSAPDLVPFDGVNLPKRNASGTVLSYTIVSVTATASGETTWNATKNVDVSFTSDGLSIVPVQDFYGTLAVTYTNSTSTEEGVITITYINRNDRPVANNVVINCNEDQTDFSFNLIDHITDNDDETNGTYVFSLDKSGASYTGGNTGLSVNSSAKYTFDATHISVDSSGLVTFTPPQHMHGQLTGITYTVTDNTTVQRGLDASANITINIVSDGSNALVAKPDFASLTPIENKDFEIDLSNQIVLEDDATVTSSQLSAPDITDQTSFTLNKVDNNPLLYKFVFNPGSNFSGNTRFLYQITTDDNESVTGDFDININQDAVPILNDPLPVTPTLNEGNNVTLNISDYFTDPESDSMTFSNASSSDTTVCTVSANGQDTLIVTAGNNLPSGSSAIISFKATDPYSNESTATASVTFNVVNVNNKPLIPGNVRTTSETVSQGVEANFNLSSGFFNDPDDTSFTGWKYVITEIGNNLTLTDGSTQLNENSSTNNSTIVITLNNPVTSDTFSYAIQGNEQNSDDESVNVRTVTVNGENLNAKATVSVNPLTGLAQDTDNTVTLTVNKHNPNAAYSFAVSDLINIQTFTIPNLDAGGGADVNFSFTRIATADSSTENLSGSFAITTTSTIGTNSIVGDKISFDSISFSNTPDAPQKRAAVTPGSALTSKTVNEDDNITLDINNYFYDPDSSDTLVFSDVTFNGFETVDGSGTDTLTLNPGSKTKGKTFNVTFSAKDSTDLESTDSVTVNYNVTAVNDPTVGKPVITGNGANLTGPFNDGDTLTAGISNISDLDGSTNSVFEYGWKVKTGSSAPDADDFTFGNSNTFTLQQSDMVFNENRFVFAAIKYTDDEGNLHTQISDAEAIDNKNDPPTGTVNITSNTGEFKIGAELTATHADLNDDDGIPAVVTYNYNWKRNGATSVQNGTSEKYTVTSDDVGHTLMVTVSYTDSFGSLNTIDSAFTSTITNVNVDPSLVSFSQTIDATEKTIETFSILSNVVSDSVHTTTGIGETLKIRFKTVPDVASEGTITHSRNDMVAGSQVVVDGDSTSFDYLCTTDLTGTPQFTATLVFVDSENNESDVYTLTFNVTEFNDPPKVANQNPTLIVEEDSSNNSVSFFDSSGSDVSDSESDASLTIWFSQLPSNGTLTDKDNVDVSSGSDNQYDRQIFKYTPTENYAGSDLIEYYFRDTGNSSGSNIKDSSKNTMTITVNNDFTDGPTFNNLDVSAATERQEVTITINQSPGDGTDVSLSGVITSSDGATITQTDGLKFKYVNDTDQTTGATLTDTLSFKLVDSCGNVTDASAVITVTGENAEPSLSRDGGTSASVPENATDRQISQTFTFKISDEDLSFASKASQYSYEVTNDNTKSTISDNQSVTRVNDHLEFTFTYTPIQDRNNGSNVYETITVTVTDKTDDPSNSSKHKTATFRLAITIQPYDSPILVNGNSYLNKTYDTYEDTRLLFGNAFITSVTDVDGDNSFNAISPALNKDDFTYRVRMIQKGEGKNALAEITSDLSNIVQYSDGDVLKCAYDVDLTYEQTRTLTFTPEHNVIGKYRVSFKVFQTDAPNNYEDSVQANFTVRSIIDPPKFKNDIHEITMRVGERPNPFDLGQFTEITEDYKNHFQYNANANIEKQLTYIIGNPRLLTATQVHAEISGNNLIFDPSGYVGEVIVSVYIDDLNHLSNPLNIHYNIYPVNRTHVVEPNTDVSVTEDTETTITLASIDNLGDASDNYTFKLLSVTDVNGTYQNTDGVTLTPLSGSFDLSGTDVQIKYKSSSNYNEGVAQKTNVISYSIVDQSDNAVMKTTYVTVNNKNNLPVISANPTTNARVDELYYYKVDASDEDNDNLTYNVTVEPSSNSWLDIDSNGVLSGTPGTTNANKEYTVNITVSDGKDSVSHSGFVINVTDANRTPTITSAANLYATEGEQYRYQVDATDDDGDNLTYAISGTATKWLSIDASGLITGTPKHSNLQDTGLSIKVSDGNGGSTNQTFSIVITNVKTIHTLLEPGSQSAQEFDVSGTTILLCTITDPDKDYPTESTNLYKCKITQVTDVSGTYTTMDGTAISLNSDFDCSVGEVNIKYISSDNFTTTENLQRDNEIDFTITNPDISGTNTQNGAATVTVHDVNDLPYIDNTQGRPATESVSTTWNLDSIVSDHDNADGDLVYSDLSFTGAPSGVDATLNSSGDVTFTYTASPYPYNVLDSEKSNYLIKGDSPIDLSYTFNVTDGNETVNLESFVRVSARDYFAPIGLVNLTSSCNEDDSGTVDLTPSIQSYEQDTSGVTWEIVSVSNKINSSLTSISGNTLTFTPKSNVYDVSGDTTVEFKAKQSDASDSNVATCFITINPITDHVEFSTVTKTSINQNEPINLNLRDTFTSVDPSNNGQPTTVGGSFSYTFVSFQDATSQDVTATGHVDPSIDSSTGDVTYTPGYNVPPGVYTLTYDVAPIDDSGSVLNAKKRRGTHRIDIVERNQKPVIHKQISINVFDTSANGTYDLTDASLASDENSYQTISFELQPKLGYVLSNGNKRLDATGNDDFLEINGNRLIYNLEDRWTSLYKGQIEHLIFNIKAKDDGSGNLLSDTNGVINIHITGTYQAPTFDTDNVWDLVLNEDHSGNPTPYQTDLTQYLDASDNTTYSYELLDVSEVSGVIFDSLTLDSNGMLRYSLIQDKNTRSSSPKFTVKITDDNNSPNGNITVTVNVVVNPVNDAPVVNDVSLTTNEPINTVGSPQEIQLSGSDVDVSDNLTYKLVSLGQLSTIGKFEDSDISGLDFTRPNPRFTPNSDASGTVVLQYYATDGLLDSSNANITITVNRQDDPATGSVTISAPSGLYRQGATLTATSTVDDEDGSSNSSFQWMRVDGSTVQDITSEDGTNYTLVNDDVGKTIKVRFKYTDSYGAKQVISEATPVIIDLNDSPTMSGPRAAAKNEVSVETPRYFNITVNDIDISGAFNQITYSVSYDDTTSLISDVLFDDSGLHFKQQPYEHDTIVISLIATDNGGLNVSRNFTYTVNKVDNKPIINTDNLSLNNIKILEPYSSTFTVRNFDNGSIGTPVVNLGWLNLVESGVSSDNVSTTTTYTLSGTPQQTDESTSKLTITVTDLDDSTDVSNLETTSVDVSLVFVPFNFDKDSEVTSEFILNERTTIKEGVTLTVGDGAEVALAGHPLTLEGNLQLGSGAKLNTGGGSVSISGSGSLQLGDGATMTLGTALNVEDASKALADATARQATTTAALEEFNSVMNAASGATDPSFVTNQKNNGSTPSERVTNSKNAVKTQNAAATQTRNKAISALADASANVMMTSVSHTGHGPNHPNGCMSMIESIIAALGDVETASNSLDAVIRSVEADASASVVQTAVETALSNAEAALVSSAEMYDRFETFELNAAIDGVSSETLELIRFAVAYTLLASLMIMITVLFVAILAYLYAIEEGDNDTADAADNSITSSQTSTQSTSQSSAITESNNKTQANKDNADTQATKAQSDNNAAIAAKDNTGPALEVDSSEGMTVTGTLDLNGSDMVIESDSTLTIGRNGMIIFGGAKIINKGEIIDKNHKLLLEDPGRVDSSGGSLLGDPYIKSANGKVTKTPDKHGYYRLFENNDIYINVEVDELDISEKLNKFLTERNFKVDKSMGKLIDRGYWNKSVYIESEGNTLTYNLFDNKLMNCNESNNYFNIIYNKKSRHNKLSNVLVDDVIEETINISWKHSVYGRQSVSLDLYKNPQIQNSINFNSFLVHEHDSIGLLVRNYKARYMSLNKLAVGEYNKLSNKLETKISAGESVLHETSIKEKNEKWYVVNNKI